MGEPRKQQARLLEALEHEGEGYRLVRAGDDAAGRAALGQAAVCYRRSWYALGLAALVEGEDAVATRAAAGMREGGGAFERTAAAMEALAAGDRDGYRR